MKIKCGNCGFGINDNPEKHKHRPKWCPSCGQPYTKAKPFIKSPVDFKRVKGALQKVFSFFPKTDRKKVVIYVCPVCGAIATDKDDMKMASYPDKVASWRAVPTCKQCGSHLVRRRLR